MRTRSVIFIAFVLSIYLNASAVLTSQAPSTQTIGSSGSILSSASPVYDYLVYTDGTNYFSKNVVTGDVEYGNESWTAINNVMGELPNGGKIKIQSGTYYLGARVQVDDCEANWVSTNAAVSSSLDKSDYKEGSGAVYLAVGDAFSTGLMAYHDFSSPQDLSSYDRIGFWLKPNIDLGGSDAGLRLLLDDSLGCSSPLRTLIVGHPENTETIWKYYICELFDASSLKSVRSIGISSTTDRGSYNLKIDGFVALKGTIRIRSNILLDGDELARTIFYVNAHANIDAIRNFHYSWGGTDSNIEISNIEIDGNIDNQDAIDYCRGISLFDVKDSYCHHNYVHHLKGDGIKARESQNVTIGYNRANYTENAGVSICWSSYVKVVNNTLGYNTNDDNIWVLGSDNNLFANNTCFNGGVSNGIRFSYGSRFNVVEGNTFSGHSNYGIFIDNAADYGNTIRNNVIRRVRVHGIVIAAGAYGCNVTGNYVELVSGNGIVLNGDNNYVSSNIISNCGRRGMEVNGGSNIINDNTTSGNQNGGIYLSVSSTNNQGIGNHCSDGIVDLGTNNNVS